MYAQHQRNDAEGDDMRVRELTLKYAPSLVTFDHRRPIRSAREALPILALHLANECVEVFTILCLSTRCRLLCLHDVSRGSLDATVVHPREVFRAAVLSGAATVILAHNHPSGDPTPSPEDVVLTTRLVEAGRIVGIQIADHVIVGENAYYSFVEAGRMSWP